MAHTNNNCWEEGLSFLAQINISEPTFRQSLITTIHGRLLDSVVETAFDILEAINQANQQASTLGLRRDGGFDPTPIWLLLILFEQLVLFPTTLEDGQLHKTSLNQEIHRRLRLFRSGQLRALYEESRAVESRTPKQQAESPERIQRAAQAAADCDNFKSANARLTKTTPIAPISDGEGGNIDVLAKLFPESLGLPDHRRERRTRSSCKNGTRLLISPRMVLRTLRGLNRGKASDLHLGSLDLFIQMAKTHERTGKKKGITARQKAIAKFFTNVVNGDVPEKVQNILRTTYLVALQKDPEDLSKLRPLGVPSAIRRVAAVLILATHRAKFARELLPFNYAIGVNGGIDVITTTLRLGLDKFMRKPELDGKLPSRALVSLDIRNMFNAVSRQKLREIMRKRFPELENFADMLYEKDGRTAVKLHDGRWTYLSVCEGFAQGCPMSPVFAAIVLNEILTAINRDLEQRSAERKRAGIWGDDAKGSVAIILAYVDDVNMLVPLEDVEFVLQKFKEYGEPLGAIMNTEKTRIMTSTLGSSTVEKLLSNASAQLRNVGASLQRAIASFSTEIVDDERVPVEVTTGLRVLGVPVGCPTFCRAFIQKQMGKAREASMRILEGLESCQTKLQLFKTCTIHKMTHLFASDVFAADPTALPAAWHVWTSDMVTSFDAMLNDFLADLTCRDDLPVHAQLIATMSSNLGGLGLQHPRCTAIPAAILTTKRCLEYAREGVWIGAVDTPVRLPHCITHLYENWRSSNAAPTFQLFNRYAPAMADICIKQDAVDTLSQFIYKTSPKLCKERLKDHAATLVQTFLRKSMADVTTEAKLDEMFQRTTSLALLDMPRSDPCNRQKNQQWLVSLKRKLRLELWPKDEVVMCSCGKMMDNFGDHALGCKDCKKTTAHNDMVNGIVRVLKRVLMTCGLISTPTAVETEPKNLLKYGRARFAHSTSLSNLTNS